MPHGTTDLCKIRDLQPLLESRGRQAVVFGLGAKRGRAVRRKSFYEET